MSKALENELKRIISEKKNEINILEQVLQILYRESKKDQNSSGKDPDAVSLGRKGGLKGGLARARKLSPERRSEIAKKAAETRWGTYN